MTHAFQLSTRKGSKATYRGVSSYVNKNGKQWKVKICLPGKDTGKSQFWGSFTTEHEAAAYFSIATEMLIVTGKRSGFNITATLCASLGRSPTTKEVSREQYLMKSSEPAKNSITGFLKNKALSFGYKASHFKENQPHLSWNGG